MFARASIASGLLRRQSARYSLASGFLGVRPKKKKRKFSCYVPFMWQALVLALAGTLLIIGGIVMCTFGYLADNAVIPTPPSELEGSTTDEGVVTVGALTTVEQYPYYSHCVRYLIYVGPVLMGSGCFLVVVASVVVCETRDKILDILERQKQSPVNVSQLTKPKPDFFRLVVSIGLPAGRRSRAFSLTPDEELCPRPAATVDDPTTSVGQTNDVISDDSGDEEKRRKQQTTTEAETDRTSKSKVPRQQHLLCPPLVDPKPRSASLVEPGRLPSDFVGIRSALKRLSVDANAKDTTDDDTRRLVPHDRLVPLDRSDRLATSDRLIPQDRLLRSGILLPSDRLVPNCRLAQSDRLFPLGFDPSRRRLTDASVKRVRLKLDDDEDDDEKTSKQERDQTNKEEEQEEEKEPSRRERISEACRRGSKDESTGRSEGQQQMYERN